MRGRVELSKVPVNLMLELSMLSTPTKILGILRESCIYYHQRQSELLRCLYQGPSDPFFRSIFPILTHFIL